MRSNIGCALILAALWNTGCHTMRPVTLDQLRGIEPRQVRVTRADQSIEVVSHPQVLGDTLVGFVNRTYQVMPAADLKQVLVERSAPRRTAALIIVASLALGGTALYALGASGGAAASTNSKCDIAEVGSNGANDCPQQ